MYGVTFTNTGYLWCRCEEGKMYGLLIEAIVHYIKANFGEAMWLDVRRLANIQQVSFATHELYRYTQYTLFMATSVLIYQMFNVQQI